MGLFEDLSRFLEMRLDEFLKAHPDLELQALEDKLAQQEADTLRLLTANRAEEERIKSGILATAEEIKTWHVRIEKAMRANRPDLAKGAQNREAFLLKQGHQLWGQMEAVQERIQHMEGLQRQMQQKRQEVKVKLQEVKAQQKNNPPEPEQWSGWNKPSNNWDELEKQFHTLEVEEELGKMRRKSQG